MMYTLEGRANNTNILIIVLHLDQLLSLLGAECCDTKTILVSKNGFSRINVTALWWVNDIMCFILISFFLFFLTFSYSVLGFLILCLVFEIITFFYSLKLNTLEPVIFLCTFHSVHFCVLVGTYTFLFALTIFFKFEFVAVFLFV